MGIYDRDYYRDSSGAWYSWDGHQATFGIIAVTVCVFVAEVITRPAGNPVTVAGAFVLPEVLDGQVWRLLTANFVHGPYNLLGVLLGMLLLYWFGKSLEEVFGTREFLAFYLTAGLVVTTGKLLFCVAKLDPVEEYLGASGVLTAVMVLFACQFPKRPVLFMFLIPMQTWLMVTILVGMNVLGFPGGSVGLEVHLFAAAFAFGYQRSRVRLTGWVPRVFSARVGRRRPALRIAPEPREVGEPVGAGVPHSPPPAASGRNVDEQLEAKLDHVLEKVSRFGRESLTPEEREILMKASEIYKRRRS
jgi:membrane associated rhomboid family serine protease